MSFGLRAALLLALFTPILGFLGSPENAGAAAIAYLRPTQDAGTYAIWSATGAPSKADALNDILTENQTPEGSDYVSTSTSSGAQFSVLMSDVSLGGGNVTSAKAWFYTTTATRMSAAVIDGSTGGTLATQIFTTSGWHSIPFTASQSQLNNLRFSFSKEFGAPGPRIDAALIRLEVALVPSGRKLHVGISADSRSAKVPGSVQDLVAEASATWLREDLEWSQVEPSDGIWDWSKSDLMFQEAAERDMRILPILGSPPCWAAGGTDPNTCKRTYPTKDSDFADYTTHVVQRYGPEGVFWKSNPGLDPSLAPIYFEVWNEPYFMDSPKGEFNAARYGDLYKAAVIAGRSAKEETRYLIGARWQISDSADTDLISWAGSLISSESGLANYIDGLSVHPYPQIHDPFYLPESGADASFWTAKRIYEDWKSRGVNKPVWITEVGYSSCDGARCVPGQTQASREELKGNWIKALFDLAQTPEFGFVHALYLYNLREWRAQSEPTADHEEWYGILDAGKQHLPGWNSFSAAVEAYDGVPEPNSTITGQTISKGYNFASFTFSVNDSTSTFECQLDSGSWTSCTSPKRYDGVGAPGHTFRVRARNAEAIEATPATFSW